MATSARDTINGFAARVERPSCAGPIVEGIPEELRSFRQWVVWRYEWRLNRDSSGKWTKVLHNPANGRNADSTKPSTWGTFEAALSAYQRDPNKWDGIGFVFANGYGGIDLDDCRDPLTGKIEAWALEIVRQIDSYTEISPSGKGLHVFARAMLAGEGVNRRNWHGREIEIYDRGRYFTVTGNRLDGSTESVKERQAEVIALYERVRIETGDKPKKERAPKVERAASARHHTTIDDDELIRRMLALQKFEDLFTGGAHSYGSDSEADFAFVSILCAATDDDEQIARIWRLSGLGREKLNRRDYIDRTIRAARNRQPETEQQKTAPRTHRAQIICKMAAALNLSDEVFRTLLAIIAIANGRKTFNLSGWKLAAWLRTPEGWSAAEWKHSAENDFVSERVGKQRAIESDFGSARIRRLIEALRSIYPMLKVKEKGGGFDIDGNRRGPSRYALDLRLIEEAEALAEKKLPERLEANNLRFADNPVLARQVAEHEAREIAAIEVAARYLPKPAEQEQTEEKESCDPVAELYRRQAKLTERLLDDARKLAEVWQDLNDSNAEATIKKGQILQSVDELLTAAFSPEFRLKLKKRKRHQFSQEKQGLNSNAQYGLDAVTDRIDPISQNAPPEQRENPTPISVKDSQDFKSDDWLIELADEDAPPIRAEECAAVDPGVSVRPCETHQAMQAVGPEAQTEPGNAAPIVSDEPFELDEREEAARPVEHSPPLFMLCLQCGVRLEIGESPCSGCGAPVPQFQDYTYRESFFASN